MIECRKAPNQTPGSLQFHHSSVIGFRTTGVSVKPASYSSVAACFMMILLVAQPQERCLLSEGQEAEGLAL